MLDQNGHGLTKKYIKKTYIVVYRCAKSDFLSVMPFYVFYGYDWSIFRFYLHVPLDC